MVEGSFVGIGIGIGVGFGVVEEGREAPSADRGGGPG